MNSQKGLAPIILIIIAAVIIGAGAGGYWYEFKYLPAEYEKELLGGIRDGMGKHPVAFGIKYPSGKFINPGDLSEAELTEQEAAVAELKKRVSELNPPRFGITARHHKELVQSLEGYLKFGIPDNKKAARFFGLAESIRLLLAKLSFLDYEPDAPAKIYNDLLMEIIKLSEDFFRENPEQLSTEESMKFNNLRIEWRRTKPLLVTIASSKLGASQETVKKNADRLLKYSRALDDFQQRGLSMSSPSAIFFTIFGEESNVFKEYQKIQAELRGTSNASAIEQPESSSEEQLLPRTEKQPMMAVPREAPTDKF